MLQFSVATQPIEMGRLVCVVVFLYVFCVVRGLPRVNPQVDTKVGLIRGLASANGEYSMFLGIPYATVNPLNPFGPSIPHGGFETAFDAVDDSAVCPQREEFNQTIVGTLDCLHLNVYVPNTASSDDPRPVLIWIHGGGFSYGDGGRFKHDPKYLVRHDVIVITINYRLGAYGFMCLDDPRVPGNQGLKDQLTALRWVKNNIEAFGGDSSKITIAGQSAGGVSVDFHLTYTNEDLFNNVIIQSGTAFAPFIVHETDPTGPLLLATHLGFPTESLDEALEFLRTVDTNSVVAAAAEIRIQTRPCHEREFEKVERFITDQPTAISVPNVRNVPILIGFNSNERGSSYENIPPENFEQMNPFPQFIALLGFSSEYLEEMTTIVRQFYIGDKDISIDVKEEMLDFVSDFGYYHPSNRRIESYVRDDAKNIFHYAFAYDGQRNFEKVKSNVVGIRGAVHEDELGYLFDMALFEDPPTPGDQLTIDRMTTLWTNFVKYSNPIPEVSEILPVQWPAIANDTLYYLDIDSEINLRMRPFYHRMAFWDLFFKLNPVF